MRQRACGLQRLHQAEAAKSLTTQTASPLARKAPGDFGVERLHAFWADAVARVGTGFGACAPNPQIAVHANLSATGAHDGDEPASECHPDRLHQVRRGLLVGTQQQGMARARSGDQREPPPPRPDGGLRVYEDGPDLDSPKAVALVRHRVPESRTQLLPVQAAQRNIDLDDVTPWGQRPKVSRFALQLRKQRLFRVPFCPPKRTQHRSMHLARRSRQRRFATHCAGTDPAPR